MKKNTTIHLSLPAGSRPPEMHVQTAPATVAYLTARAAAADVSMTSIASLILAANAAAGTAGAADMTIDFRFLLGESREARAGLADVRALTQAIAGMRLATASRSPSSEAERESRAARLATGDKALAAVASTLAKLETLCGMASGQLVAEVVTRALSAPEPPAAAPAPVPARSPGVPKEDAEIILRNNLPRAHEHWQIWTMCAMAAAAAGREFTVPRPKAKPTPPAPTPPTPTATPPSRAVDKLVTAAAATSQEGQP